jgi:outer membrane protein assembly factor BamB
MRPRTVVAVVVVLGLLAGGALFALGGADGTGSLDATWVSDTGRDVRVNHHEPMAGQVDGVGVVFAPVSGADDTDDCALFALDAASGDRRWNHSVSRADCAIHAVADPSLGDVDEDGTREVFVATTERRVFGFDPTTGDREFAYRLSAYGYSGPLVADFLGDSAPEVVVVDAKGEVSVVYANGTVAWTHQLDAYTFGQPAIADFDADGDRELAVGTSGEGVLALFERDGSLAWQRANATEDSITWTNTGQLDDDPAREILAATTGGEVVVVDGRFGDVEWRRSFGSLAAVHAFGDGDDDGTVEVYATAQDGVLRALDGTTGETEWTTTLTTADVQMMPPPVLGDVDGDGSRELVVAGNDGTVSVVAPDDGAVTATYERDVIVYAHPRLADTDGDGVQEIYVMYADGSVVALSAIE